MQHTLHKIRFIAWAVTHPLAFRRVCRTIGAPPLRWLVEELSS